MLYTDKKAEKVSKSSTFSDSDFLCFLENNFSDDFSRITSDTVSAEVVYSILQKHSEKYKIWKKIPQWIKDYYGDKLPAEVFTIHEPYQQFIYSLEQVIKMSPVYDYVSVNTTIFNSEYAQSVYNKYASAGYSEASIAKMILVSEDDKKLFDSGEINTVEGKFLHKVNQAKKYKIIEEAMTPDEDVLHSLKELRRIEAKLNKVTDEAEKAKLQKERNDVVLYLAKGITDVSDPEFVDALSGAIEKLYDKDASSKDVSDAIKNVRAKLKGKNKGAVKKENESENSGVEKQIAKIGGKGKQVESELNETQDENGKVNHHKSMESMARILALLSEHDSSGQMAAILKETGDKGFNVVRERIIEVAPKPGFHSRRLEERLFSKKQKEALDRILKGEDVDLSFLKEEKEHLSKEGKPAVSRIKKGEKVDLSALKDKEGVPDSKRRVLESLMRIQGDKKPVVAEKKEVNDGVTKIIANKSNVDLSL